MDVEKKIPNFVTSGPQITGLPRNINRPNMGGNGTNMNGVKPINRVIKLPYSRPQQDSKEANVYIAGLPQSLTQNQLEEIFGPYGQISTSRILIDNVTGQSRGCGFVRYEQRSQAECAIKELNGTIPKGCMQPIIVRFANNPSTKVIVPQLPAPLMNNVSVPMNRRVPGPVHNSTGRFKYPPMVDPMVHGPVNNGTGWPIFVYNLEPDVEEATLWPLFGPFGAVQNIRVIRDPQTNKCKGFAFVTMTNYEEAVIAIQSLNGFTLGNRVLQVSFKTNKNKAS